MREWKVDKDEPFFKPLINRHGVNHRYTAPRFEGVSKRLYIDLRSPKTSKIQFGTQAQISIFNQTQNSWIVSESTMLLTVPPWWCPIIDNHWLYPSLLLYVYLQLVLLVVLSQWLWFLVQISLYSEILKMSLHTHLHWTVFNPHFLYSMIDIWPHIYIHVPTCRMIFRLETIYLRTNLFFQSRNPSHQWRIKAENRKYDQYSSTNTHLYLTTKSKASDSFSNNVIAPCLFTAEWKLKCLDLIEVRYLLLTSFCLLLTQQHYLSLSICWVTLTYFSFAILKVSLFSWQSSMCLTAA